MLGKLLKYDFKSSARIFLLIYAALIVLSGVNRLMSMLLPSNTVTNIFKTLTTVMYVLMIIALLIVTFIIALFRFYKETASREAYLTASLPVRPITIIASKFISAAVWMLATSIVIALSLLIIINDFTAAKRFFDIASAEWMAQGMGDITVFFASLLFYSIISYLCMLPICYFCIAAGTLANKAKIPVAIAVYVGITTILQIVSLIAIAIWQGGNLMDFLISGQSAAPIANMNGMLNMIYLITAAATLLIAIGCVIGTNYIYTKKYNLT